MSSKIIEIHRKANFIQENNQEAEVQEYFGMAFKAVGAYWKEVGSVYASGLSRMEEDHLMPEIIGGLDPVKENREFRIKVQEHFKNINTKIPPEGLKLQIGLEQDDVPMFSKPDPITGMVVLQNPPLKIGDYIKYKHLVGHPHVGKNRDEAERYQHIQFYVVDKAADTTQKSKLRDKEDIAQRDYLGMNKDMQKAEMVLTLLGINTKGMGEQALILELKSQATIDPDASDTINIERLEKFVQIANDKDLHTKYDIMEMVRFQILERIRSKVLVKESGETIGENLREAVDWMLDKANSKQVNAMYATLDSLGRDRKIRHASPHLSDSPVKKPVNTPIE